MDYNKILEQIKEKTLRRMALQDPKDYMHENWETVDGKYTDRMTEFNGWDWTRSFLSGVIALLYKEYGDEKFKTYLEDLYEQYNSRVKISKKANNMHHDSGFIYVLYSIAHYAVTGNKKAYDMSMDVCDEFAKTFRIETGLFQGFGGPVGDTITIVDDMMNISLMMWAYEQTGHTFYRTLFTTHIDTMLDTMLRDDYSLRHSFRFDEKGNKITEENYCGYAPGSQWARGNAWVVYGLVNAISVLHHTDGMEYVDILKYKKKLDDAERMVYENDMTKVNKYVRALNGILNCYFSKLYENGIPCWDLKEFTQENGPLVDTSAAMILTSALYKLCEVYDVSKLQGVASHAKEFADKILDSVTREYLAKPEDECFIVGGQAGPKNVGCVWGDYFYAEAIMRRLHGSDCPEFWGGEKEYKSYKPKKKAK